ncbi:hypothetical protein ACHAPT_008275 [Fusarium lateritium]
MDHLFIFIQDYLTKATSPCPARAYLFLPSLGPGDSRPYFKNRVLGETTFGNHQTGLFWKLSLSERERLVAAFLRYELLCQALRPRLQDLEEESDQYGEMLKDEINHLQSWEREGILCVHEYVKSLYGTMFAHCAGSWLPDLPSATSGSVGLMFPDNYRFSHSAYFNDMKSKAEETEARITNHLALFGFDLVNDLLLSTQRNHHLQLKQWFSLFEKQQERFSRFISIDDIVPTPDISNEDEVEEPGQWESLRWEIPSPPDDSDEEDSVEDFTHLQLSIYRQRAWVFFDDGKWYPSHHFPTTKNLQLQSRVLHHKVMYTLLPRSQRRSQKWHDDRTGVDRPTKKVAGQSYTDLEEVPSARLPRFFDTFSDAELARFWY